MVMAGCSRAAAVVQVMARASEVSEADARLLERFLEGSAGHGMWGVAVCHSIPACHGLGAPVGGQLTVGGCITRTVVTIAKRATSTLIVSSARREKPCERGGSMERVPIVSYEWVA